MSEQKPEDTSRSANQIKPEPVPPTPGADDAVAAGTATDDDDSRPARRGPDAAGARAAPRDPDDTQDVVGGDTDTTFDLAPAHGTSEQMKPVQGVHRPDVGPGGEDFDTAEQPVPGRMSQARE